MKKLLAFQAPGFKYPGKPIGEPSQMLSSTSLNGNFGMRLPKLSSSNPEFFKNILSEMSATQIKSHECDIINDIKSFIIGYNSKIITPIGKLCAIYADHTATGRPFSLFERHILEDIKPWIANSHTETSEMGKFSTHLLHYSEESILNSFSVSKKTHFAVPAGFGCTGAMERLIRILDLEREVINISHEGSKKKEEDDRVPLVIITPYEHHSNILPWVQTGCYVKVIESDNFGNIDSKKLEELLKTYSKRKRIIISTSGASNVTSQHTNLADLNDVIKDFRRKTNQKEVKVHWNIDGAAFCSHARLDLKVELSDCDSVVLSPHKNLGGTEATGVLIMRNAAYNKEKTPSFPGGGTVSAVIGIEEGDIFYDSDPAAREMPGSPNVIGFYRAALTFQLQDWIGLELIRKRETENAAYFFKRLSDFNTQMEKMDNKDRKIVFIGEHDLTKRYGVFSFNIIGPGSMELPSGEKLFHPHFIAKILNDFFGIQVRSGCSCAGPFGVQLLGITHEQANAIAHKVVEGQEAIKPGWVRLDTNFIFCKFELEYLVKAIELIALHAEKLLGFYVQESSGQWQLNFSAYHPGFIFGMPGVLRAAEETPEFELSQRESLFQIQLETAQKILEDPYQYLYKIKHNGLEDVRDRVKKMFNRGEKTEPTSSRTVSHESAATKGIKNSGSSSQITNKMEPISEDPQENGTKRSSKNLVVGSNGNSYTNGNGFNHSEVYSANGAQTNLTSPHSNGSIAGSKGFPSTRLRIICSTCKKGIDDGNPIKTGGKSYHQECFVCSNCNVPLKSHFLQDDDRVCCQDCFSQIKCGACGLNLFSDHVLVMTKGFHVDCYAAIASKKKNNFQGKNKSAVDGRWK